MNSTAGITGITISSASQETVEVTLAIQHPRTNGTLRVTLPKRDYTLSQIQDAAIAEAMRNIQALRPQGFPGEPG